MTHRSVAAVVFTLALVAGPHAARADGCPAPTASANPSDYKEVSVGRLCTIVVALPGGTIEVKDEDGNVIKVSEKVIGSETREQAHGCNPSDYTYSTIGYEVRQLIPDEPLPANTRISVTYTGADIYAFDVRTIATLLTTDQLDEQGCDGTAPEIHGPGACSPGVQVCVSSSSGSSNSDGSNAGGCAIASEPGAAPTVPWLLLVFVALFVVRRRVARTPRP
ncbi:MAG: hypothetical protein KC503_12755 [Myxococcales bacterium]|nr:hypothetical protein [Myxococcales bacterium]